MGKWKEVTIGDIAKVKSSKRIFKSDYVSEGVSFYRSKEVGELYHTNSTNSELFISREKYEEIKNKFGVPKKGDLLLTSVGTIGKTWIVDEREFYYKDGNLTQLIVNDNFSVEFLQYFFKSSLFIDVVFDKVNGTAYNALTIIKIRNFKIPLPPLLEQQRIVAKLDGLFAKIDQAIGLLEENIAHTQALMGSVLDAGLELLEKNHSVTKVCDVVKLSRGHNPPKKDFIYEARENYVRFLQIRDGSSDKNACYVPITKKLHLVTKNDLLLVAYRHVGKVFRKMEGAFNVALCKLENLDESKLNMTYMFYLVQSKYIKGELLKRSERALIPSMSVDHLKSLKIPFPDIKKQNELALKFENVYRLSKKAIKTQTQKLNQLKALKSSLLDQAFKGEL
tara:strand:+ start:5839 stop:7017 length:1179 start_codon:yes stop_codon:yes gene_type:complete